MENVDNLAMSQSDWIVNCSDDELSSSNDQNQVWEPLPNEVITLYEFLDEKEILELEWQCPGRRSPSVHSIQSEFLDKVASDDDDSKQMEPNEFDFDDEFGVEHFSPKIEPRKRGSQANSSIKRVARLDKVMNDIQRHRKLDELELQKFSSRVANQSLSSTHKTSPSTNSNTTE